MMTMLWLDHKIFGNGYGFASPYFDNRFYWLNGELYTFSGGLGAQLKSVQWTHPKAGERRNICGQTFRPFHSHRRWGRVMVSWAWIEMPSSIDDAQTALRQLEMHLGGVSPYLPAKAIEARSGETSGSTEGESAVRQDLPKE